MSIRHRAFLLGFISALFFCGSFTATVGAQDDGPWTEKWVLIDEPGSHRQLIRASEVKIHSTIVSIRTTEGSSMGWQRDFYLGDAPAIPEDLSGISKPVLEAALEAQKELSAQAGDLAEPIKREEARLAFAINAIDKAAAEEVRQEMEVHLKAWQETEYNPEAQYPLDQLDAMILQGQELIEKVPDFEREMRERLDTMFKHREHLAAGRKFWKGQWIDPNDIGQSYLEREKEIYSEYFNGDISVTLPSVAVSGIPVYIIFTPAALTLLVLLSFLFQVASKGKMPKGRATKIMIVILLGLIGYNSYFLYGIFAGKKSIAEMGVEPAAEAPALAETALGRLVFFCSEPEMLVIKDTDQKVALKQEEINVALQRHLVYEGLGSEGTLDMVRKKTAFLIDPRRLSILDEVTLMNRTFLMQTHIMVELTDESIEFYDFEVVLGNNKLPGVMAAHVWKKLQPQFQSMIRQLALGKYYGIHKIKPGEIIMLMTGAPEGAIDVNAEVKRIVEETGAEN
jgi:hypothetical protein